MQLSSPCIDNREHTLLISLPIYSLRPTNLGVHLRQKKTFKNLTRFKTTQNMLKNIKWILTLKSITIKVNFMYTEEHSIFSRKKNIIKTNAP